MDLYFERHDGQAVTCDEFRAAMADANDSDAIRSEAFGRWYAQAGTPTLTVRRAALSASGTSYAISLAQSTPPTPGQPHKDAMLLPVAVGLLASVPDPTAGGPTAREELYIRLAGSPPETPYTTTVILPMNEGSQTFKLELAPNTAVGDASVSTATLVSRPKARIHLSVLRGWSAPCKLVYPDQTAADLAALMGFDSDGFNRYEAAARFATRCLVDAATSLASVPSSQRAAHPLAFDAAYVDAWASVFDSADEFAAAVRRR